MFLARILAETVRAVYATLYAGKKGVEANLGASRPITRADYKS
jgi:hypothetical protein